MPDVTPPGWPLPGTSWDNMTEEERCALGEEALIGFREAHQFPDLVPQRELEDWLQAWIETHYPH